MTRKLSRTLAVGLALALALAAPALAFADDHGGRYGYRTHGHGYGHGPSHYRPDYRPYYRPVYRDYYPRPGYFVGALPPSYTVVRGGWGAPYYYGGGRWYRSHGPRFVVVGAPVGLVVPFLPPFYTTVSVGGIPYYCAGSDYYVQTAGGYAVVAPPAPPYDPSPTPAGSEEIYVYPERGQNESRQSDDRYACHRWAVDETGFDPTRALDGEEQTGALADRGNYQRAMTACLVARGYSVR